MASSSSKRPSSPLPSTSSLRPGVVETSADSAITTASETNYESEISQALSKVHVSGPGKTEKDQDQEDRKDLFNITCDTSATDSQTDDTDISNSSLPRALGPEVNLQEYDLSENDKKALGLVQLSFDDARKLEAQTVGQSRNSLWGKSRLNRLTASNFGLICKRRSYTEKFAKSVLTETKDLSRIPAIKYGRENEAKAIEVYHKYMTKAGYRIKILENGIVVNPSFPWLGASPDGKILDSNAGFGLLEVKCPASFKDVDPLEACASKNFYCELVEGKPRLKRKHSYFYQVQGQMGICGALWCDFVVYTKRGMIISRIEYDEDFWMEIMKKMTIFYMTSCLQLVCHNDST
ncbi:uncharacterized protein LOC135486546 [Lineus longissimus]|uniref:uncharacterized protein LOC135486546 n=1 Tax=Lineus longissimus TaxID=88925 RepID=UPI002B4D19BD